MKGLFLFAQILLFVSFSHAATTNRTALTSEQRAALRNQRRAQRLAASGGLIEQNVQGKSVLIVNAQTRIPMSCLEEIATSIRKLAHVKVESAMGESKSAAKPSKDHPVVISLIDDPSSDATILVAPEQCWATVNIANVLKGNPSEQVRSTRIHKEVWRATAMVMGAANSMSQPCLLRQINTLKELDNTRNLLPSPQPVSNMKEVANKLAIAGVRITTYRLACQEGWAPAPTNDIQKAIWDKVHAMPTSPIKIKPETKKVRE